MMISELPPSGKPGEILIDGKWVKPGALAAVKMGDIIYQGNAEYEVLARMDKIIFIRFLSGIVDIVKPELFAIDQLEGLGYLIKKSSKECKLAPYSRTEALYINKNPEYCSTHSSFSCAEEHKRCSFVTAGDEYGNPYDFCIIHNKIDCIKNNKTDTKPYCFFTRRQSPTGSGKELPYCTNHGSFSCEFKSTKLNIFNLPLFCITTPDNLKPPKSREDTTLGDNPIKLELGKVYEFKIKKYLKPEYIYQECWEYEYKLIRAMVIFKSEKYIHAVSLEPWTTPNEETRFVELEEYFIKRLQFKLSADQRPAREHALVAVRERPEHEARA